MTAASFRRAMVTACIVVFIFGGAAIGSIGMFVPMVDSPETPLVRMLLELVGSASLLAGIVTMLLESGK